MTSSVKVSLGTGVLVALVVLAGVGVRATYGARVSGDEPQYLLTALSIFEDGNLDICDELAEQRYRAFHEADLDPQTRPLEDGSRISPHDPLLPLLLALPMGLWGWVGAKTAIAVMAGLVAGLLVWLAVTRFGVKPRVAALTVAVFALSPPSAVYATQVYPEVPAALAVTIAVVGLFDPARSWLTVLGVVALPWLGVKYVPVAAVLASAVWIRSSHRHFLTGVLTAAGIYYLWFHLSVYGGWTAYASGDQFVGGELTVIGAKVDLWGRSSRLVGLLVDRGFGLAAWQPAYLLAPIALGWVIARRIPGWVLVSSLIAVGWLVATFVALTMHGWWFPGRQVVVILPMVVLVVALWVDRSPRNLGAVALLGGLGVAAFGFLVVEGLSGRLTWVVDFGATVDPIYRAVRLVLPDYQSPTRLTWLLHGAWVATALGLLRWGWIDGSLIRRTNEQKKEMMPI